MFDLDAPCRRPESRSSKSLCAKYFPRKRRQCADNDALAYGYIHPDHINKSKCKRTLSPGRMYGQQAYGRPQPARFYQNGVASESYVSPDTSQNRPYRGRQPWASSSVLDLPPRYTPTPHGEGRKTRPYPQTRPDPVSPPQQPPRPAAKNVHFWEDPATRGKSQGAALADDLASRLGVNWSARDSQESANNEALWMEALDRELSLVEGEQEAEHEETQRSRGRDEAPVARPKTNSSKTWAFANSRLPPHQPPFKAYFETWRLICRAARESARVYQRPQRDQREYFIAADWRHRTKAMVLKSTPLDDQNLIVFSIRGSQINFVDWNVNLQPAPTAPEGFLDDGQNACHSGFLKVAKAMIVPVAARLRQLLEQDPSRCASSLLITGHSAGGAVASLLYMHMLATSVESELNVLTGCFKRVHCITFGAPPISFLPLQKPSNPRASKSLFLSFVNEGDLIVRADKAYMLSLAKLLAGSKGNGNSSTLNLVKKASHAMLKSSKSDKPTSKAPYWPVPESTLSNAGRLIVLREKPGSQRNPSVEAITTSDEKMRHIIFGDTSMHSMAVYQQRVEALAFAAMLGEDGG